MIISVGIALRPSSAEGQFSPATLTGPVFQSPPTVSPSDGHVGIANMVTDGTHITRGGGNVTYTREWFVDDIKVADGHQYTPILSNVSGVLSYRETPVETGGMTPGEGRITWLGLGQVVHMAPIASGNLLDQSFNTGSGIQTYDVSAGFVGDDLVFDLVLAPTGVSIDYQTGIVSCATNTIGVQNGVEISVQASNSGGSATNNFLLNIVSDDAVAPTINTCTIYQTAQDAPLTAVLDFTEVDSPPVTLYLVGVVDGESAPTAAQIIEGHGSDGLAADIATSFSASADGSQTTAVSDVSSATYDFYAVAVDSAGNTSATAAAPDVSLSFSVGGGSYSFTDDFSEHADGTSLRDLPEWTETVQNSTRSMEINASVAMPNGTTGASVSYSLRYTGTLTDDQAIEITLNTVPATGALQLLLCETDSDNRYQCRIGSSGLRIIQRVDGTSTNLTSDTAVTFMAGDTVRFERSGTNLRILRNGSLVSDQSATTTSLTGGGAGILQFHSSSEANPIAISNITIEDL